jgi:hypothetical protein
MTSRRRTRRADYRAEVGEADGSSESVDLDYEADIEAVYAAFGTWSAFGHALGHGRRFIGYFDAGAGRLEALSRDLHAPTPPARSSQRRHPHR